MSYETTVQLNAKPDVVFDMLTSKDHHDSWSKSKSTLQPKVDEQWEAYDGYCQGKFLELERPRKIRKMWRGSDFPSDVWTTVEVSLEEDGQGTKLTMKQEGIPEEKVAGIKDGWKSYYWDKMSKSIEERNEDAKLNGLYLGWNAIGAKDVERAKKFYTDVFGLTVMDWEPGKFAMWFGAKDDQGKDKDVDAEFMENQWASGGIRLLGENEEFPSEDQACRQMYLRVNDMKSVSEKITANGGKLVGEPYKIPMTGHWAQKFVDSEGNQLQIYSEQVENGYTDDKFRPVTICWCEMPSNDFSKTVDFYVKALGWNFMSAPAMKWIKPGDDVSDVDYLMWSTYQAEPLDTSGTKADPGEKRKRPPKMHTFGGVFKAPTVAPGKSILWYVNVKDIDATAEAIKEHGGKLLSEKIARPSIGYMQDFEDPVGNHLVLCQPCVGS